MNPKSAAFAAALVLAAAQASAATTITFENLAEGATLSNQYAALGVLFSPNAFSGAGGPNGDWATNTNMIITSSVTGDVGSLGTPSLVSGNVLHAYGNLYATGWLGEDGDPSFLITFTTPVTSFSADFAGIGFPSSTTLTAYNGNTVIGVVAATATGQQTLSFAAASITKIAVTPGEYFDWVGVDNISFTQAVPEPASYAMLALGLGLLAYKRRARG